MITITDNKVTIEFEHPCPFEVVKDIQLAIILSLQQKNYNEPLDKEEIQHSNYFVLELLKQMIEVKQ